MKGTKHFNNSINTTYKEVHSRQGDTSIQFDMSTISIKLNDNEQITFNNENFEIIMAEYIRRKKELKEINRPKQITGYYNQLGVFVYNS